MRSWLYRNGGCAVCGIGAVNSSKYFKLKKIIFQEKKKLSKLKTFFLDY